MANDKLHTTAGLRRYVQETMIPEIEQAWRLRQTVDPHAVVFARYDAKEEVELDGVRPVRVTQQDDVPLKPMIRRIVHATHAKAVAWVTCESYPFKIHEGEMQAVTIQLEDSENEDLLWTAPVIKGLLSGFTCAPPASGLLKVKPTTFAPHRWMN